MRVVYILIDMYLMSGYEHLLSKVNLVLREAVAIRVANRDGCSVVESGGSLVCGDYNESLPV